MNICRRRHQRKRRLARDEAQGNAFMDRYAAENPDGTMLQCVDAWILAQLRELALQPGRKDLL